MSQTIKLSRWMVVVGVSLGLGVQAVGGVESLENPQHIKAASSVAIEPTKDSEALVMKETLTSVDRQVVQVSDDKQVASSGQEPLYRPPPRGARAGGPARERSFSGRACRPGRD